MKKFTISFVTILLFSLLVGTLLASCGSSQNPPPASSGNQLDGQTLLQERCSVCHSTERVTSAHKTTTEWKATIDRMVGKGAQLNSLETQTLIDYLAANFK